MPDPNAPPGSPDAPYRGSAVLSNRDADYAAGIILAQQSQGQAASHAAETNPEAQRRIRRKRWTRAVVLGLVAVAFAIGAAYDKLASGADSSGDPSLVLAVGFGLLALDQARAALRTRVLSLMPRERRERQ
jgi:hypothetical protein